MATPRAPKAKDKGRGSIRQAEAGERYTFASERDTLTHEGITYRGSCPMRIARALGLDKGVSSGQESESGTLR